MAMDQHDYEWRCGCGHTNPDFNDGCAGCGASRYPDEEGIDRDERGEAEAADALDLLGEECEFTDAQLAAKEAAYDGYYGDLGVRA